MARGPKLTAKLREGRPNTLSHRGLLTVRSYPFSPILQPCNFVILILKSALRYLPHLMKKYSAQIRKKKGDYGIHLPSVYPLCIETLTRSNIFLTIEILSCPIHFPIPLSFLRVPLQAPS